MDEQNCKSNADHNQRPNLNIPPRNEPILRPPHHDNPAPGSIYVPPVLPDVGVVDVAYARYSTDMQREDSVWDQFRQMRDLLAPRGFDPDEFIYMADPAVSGQKDNRPELDRIRALAKQGRLGTLCVIHQDRFSRGVNVSGMIKDLVFHGGRFISLLENIDTKTTKNWELHVGIVGVLNNQQILKIQERSREGMVGRHLDPNGSTGHFPYGYRSVPEQGQSASPCVNRRRSKMRIEVDERAAELVRRIFELYVIDNLSMTRIAQWVEEHRREYPPLRQNGGSKRVYIPYIRGLLRNSKYVGGWSFNHSGVVYDGEGEKAIRRKPPDEVIRTQRPHLRIITDELWAGARAKDAKLQEIYGYRTPTQKRRGPSEHYRKLYSKSLLQGLTYCGCCKGALLSYSSSDRRMNCKLSRDKACTNKVTLSVGDAENAVLEAFCGLIRGVVDLAPQIITRTRERILERLSAAESDRARLVEQRDTIESSINKVSDHISLHGGTKTMDAKLRKLERDLQQLEHQIKAIDQLRQDADTLPDDQWFAKRLSNLAEVLLSDLPKVAHQIRPFIKRIDAVPVLEKWNVRGWYRLRVTICLPEGLMPAVRTELSANVSKIVESVLPPDTVVEIDLGSDKLKDVDFRKIDQMLAGGSKWAAIGREFNMAPHWVKVLHRRWNGAS